MPGPFKDQAAILQKLGIESLNPMQEAAGLAIGSSPEVILVSPTGTGKTLAFLLPILAELDRNCEEIQALILVPTRELAIQIEQVLLDMGTGFKHNAVYGGTAFSKDKMNLQHPPAVLVGTPGRVADHLRRGTFATNHIETLVLDEFDKSLEIGFESEMEEICYALGYLSKKILTSATNVVQIPHFVDLRAPRRLNFEETGSAELSIKTILSPSKDKLETLVKALSHIGNVPGIVFCNFRDSIERVSDFLADHGIDHGCFHGGMEQIDRERTLVKFRNGTHQLIVATDLAARGLDIPEIKFILHYHLPVKGHEFTHRNGRTARMNKEGTAYVLQWEQESLPDFIRNAEREYIWDAPPLAGSDWKTLFLSGGRRDKISKGDIAGFCFKQGDLEKDDLGVIEIKQDCAFVAVRGSKATALIKATDNQRLKKRKIRVRLA